MASVELVNSTQNGMTYTSHTMSTGVGKADKPLAEKMEQKAGEEGTDIPLRAGTTRVGEGRDTSPEGQREQQAETEDSALCDIPEWILEDNICLNRAITPPAEQFIKDQGDEMTETAVRWR